MGRKPKTYIVTFETRRGGSQWWMIDVVATSESMALRLAREWWPGFCEACNEPKGMRRFFVWVAEKKGTYRWHAFEKITPADACRARRGIDKWDYARREVG